MQRYNKASVTPNFCLPYLQFLFPYSQFLTAELYENGSWRSLSIAGTHDGGFSVKLADGRYMVGGGFSKQGGVGQTTATDIYDPQAHAFSVGPGSCYPCFW